MRQPVLSVTKTGPEVRYVGRPVVYEITVSNKGDAPARETTLVDDLPENTTFVEASHGGRAAEGKVTWDLGTIAVGAAKKVTLSLRAVARGVARNMASARPAVTSFLERPASTLLPEKRDASTHTVTGWPLREE